MLPFYLPCTAPLHIEPPHVDKTVQLLLKVFFVHEMTSLHG